MPILEHTVAGVAPCPVALIRRSEWGDAARGVRAGELATVSRGVYALAEDWRALAPWQRYLARVHAVALRYPDAVFVLESGWALRGLPTFGEPPEVHVIVPQPSKSRRIAGVRLHSTERMPTAQQLDGILVAAAADLVVDGARARHPAVALSVANAAMRNDPSLTVATFAAASANRPTPRGARAIEWLLARASGIPESTLESVSLAVLEWLGFPAPELQRWILGSEPGEDDRVDFWWEAWRVAGEADGGIKYSGRWGDARDVLRARNARDARLQSRGVEATAHWSFSDLIAADQVRALLKAAGLPIVRPQDSAPLRTLAPALRGRPHGWIALAP